MKSIKLLFLSVKLIVLLFALFIVTESAMRIRNRIVYGAFSPDKQIAVVDPMTGLMIPKPIQGTSGNIELNSFGFRSPEIDKFKTDKTCRIVFLGESNTYCSMVKNNEATWPSLVIHNLKKKYPKVQFDWINASIPGNSLPRVKKIAELKIRKFNPDVVFVFQGINDINKRSHFLADSIGVTKKNNLISQKLLQNSVLLSWIQKNITILVRQYSANRNQQFSKIPGRLLVGTYQEELKNTLKVIKPAYPILLTLTTKVRNSQPLAIQVANANTLLYFNSWLGINGFLDALYRYNTVIENVGNHQDCLVIESDNLVAGADSTFIDSSHLTDLGCIYFANGITEKICADSGFNAILNNYK